VRLSGQISRQRKGLLRFLDAREEAIGPGDGPGRIAVIGSFARQGAGSLRVAVRRRKVEQVIRQPPLGGNIAGRGGLLQDANRAGGIALSQRFFRFRYRLRQCGRCEDREYPSRCSRGSRAYFQSTRDSSQTSSDSSTVLASGM
jgi:hypothetical protein